MSRTTERPNHTLFQNTVIWVASVVAAGLIVAFTRIDELLSSGNPWHQISVIVLLAFVFGALIFMGRSVPRSLKRASGQIDEILRTELTPCNE